MALTSMILGIAAIVGSIGCVVLGVPLSLAAIATGIIALTQQRGEPVVQNKGMAVAGICCGAAALVIPLVFVLFVTLPSFR